MTLEQSIAENLRDVRARLDAAASRAGRDPGGIRLIAVSKTFGIEHVRAARAAGQLDFGENKVQEALQKMTAGADTDLRWHLIGHLQANKAKKAVGPFTCIHSVDSLDLLRRLDTAAAEQAVSPEILVQIDLAGEATKFGAPEHDARQIVDEAVAGRAVRLAGLMILPPWSEDPEATRPWFVRLRAIRDAWLAEGVPPGALRHLSMGMSHDYEAAVEEGATMVRVGTAIFGKRTVRT